jgi:hypothetical protein
MRQMVQSYMRERFERPDNMQAKRIEVYLDACSVRGILETAHARVSDHLGATEEVLRIREARVLMRNGEQLSSEKTVLVNKTEILFIVDLTPRTSGQTGFQVERDPHEVILNVGTIWLKGRAHVPVGGELPSFFAGAMNRFMPITEATVVGYTNAEPRTVLINRDQLRCMIVDN